MYSSRKPVVNSDDDSDRDFGSRYKPSGSSYGLSSARGSSTRDRDNFTRDTRDNFTRDSRSSRDIDSFSSRGDSYGRDSRDRASMITRDARDNFTRDSRDRDSRDSYARDSRDSRDSRREPSFGRDFDKPEPKYGSYRNSNMALLFCNFCKVVRMLRLGAD